METTKKHDWTLIVVGILLILSGGVFAFMPGATLVTLTAFAGAMFLVSGIFSIINYIRFKDTGFVSGWTILYGILDILLGLMFLIHPVLLAGVIPWLIGVFVIVYGIYEIIAAFMVKRAGVSVWGWEFASGIMEIILGIMFFVFPAILIFFLAAFLLLRGITLIVFGWNLSSLKWRA